MAKLALTLNLVFLLTVSNFLFAQDGPVVVPISDDDTKLLTLIHTNKLKADKEWEDIQKEIGKKYIVVDKTSPDASDQKWYPDDTSLTWSITAAGLTSSGSITYNGINGQWVGGPPGPSEPCETPEEKKVRLAREVLQAQRDAQLAEEHKKLEEEREAKSKRIRKGFSGVDDFTFSGDYHFILQRPSPSPTESPRYGPLWNYQSVTPTGTGGSSTSNLLGGAVTN